MIRGILRDSDGVLHEDLSLAQIEKAASANDGLLWVDIEGASDEARRLLADAFNFHPLAIDDCFNGRVDTPKVDDFGPYLFIVSQSLRYMREDRQLDLTEVDIFLGKNFVVSSRQRPVEEIDDVYNRSCSNDHLLNRGSDMLVQAILDSLVDRILPAVEAIDEQLDALEEEVVDNPSRALMDRVLFLRRLAMRIRRSILPERDVVNRLSRGEFPELIDNDSRIFYRDIFDHLVRIEEILESVRDVAESVLNSYLSSVNNRMNEVMKTLSVVTAIFLPLTLIASIFGTNLDYSIVGVRSEIGFVWMLLAMVLLTGGLILYFRRRGWF